MLEIAYLRAIYLAQTNSPTVSGVLFASLFISNFQVGGIRL